jgi:CubicO group peptidase (beta-lactamase class C family)
MRTSRARCASRILLAHRSGLTLGAGDLLYWPTTTYTTEEVARRLKDVRSAVRSAASTLRQHPVRRRAVVVEQASGMKYEDFLRQRIFAPLGMNETRFNSDSAEASDNVATVTRWRTSRRWNRRRA